ncbi:MAG: hypothetical protein P1P88_23540 [Bacteroidales bacterium]|nr:hypothetical protein [Bacteroidales bacterium]
MKRKVHLFIAVIFIGSLLLITCKEKLGPNPSMKFITDAKYTFANDSVKVGDSVLIGLKCNWNGTDLLSGLNSYLNNGLVVEKSFEFDPQVEALGMSFYITKTALEEEIWQFELMDNAGQKDTLSLLLTIDHP